MRVIASALLALLAASSSSPSHGVTLAAEAADRRSHLRHTAASVVDSGGMEMQAYFEEEEAYYAEEAKQWEEAEAAAAAFEAEESLKAEAEWTSGLDGTTGGGEDGTATMAEENEDYYAAHMELADPDYGEEFAGDIVVNEEEGPPEDVDDSTAMQEAWLEELWQEAYDGAKEAGLSEEEAVEMAQATYDGAYNQALASEASGEQELPARLDDAEQTEEAALLEDYEAAYDSAIQAGKTPQEADEIAAPFYEDYMNFDMAHMATVGTGQGDVVDGVDLGPGPDVITATANDDPSQAMEADSSPQDHLTEQEKLYMLEHEHEESFTDNPEDTGDAVKTEEEIPIDPKPLVVDKTTAPEAQKLQTLELAYEESYADALEATGDEIKAEEMAIEAYNAYVAELDGSAVAPETDAAEDAIEEDHVAVLGEWN